MRKIHAITVLFSSSAAVLAVEGVVLFAEALIDAQAEPLEHAGTADDAGGAATAEPVATSSERAARADAVAAAFRTGQRSQGRTPPRIIPVRRPIRHVRKARLRCWMAVRAPILSSAHGPPLWAGRPEAHQTGRTMARQQAIQRQLGVARRSSPTGRCGVSRPTPGRGLQHSSELAWWEIRGPARIHRFRPTLRDKSSRSCGKQRPGRRSTLAPARGQDSGEAGRRCSRE